VEKLVVLTSLKVQLAEAGQRPNLRPLFRWILSYVDMYLELLKYLNTNVKRHQNCIKERLAGRDGTYLNPQKRRLQKLRDRYETLINHALSLRNQAQDPAGAFRISEVTYLDLRRAAKALTKRVKNNRVNCEKSGPSTLQILATLKDGFPHRTALTWDRPIPATPVPPPVDATEFFDAVSNF
jgi:hypothetical protein